MWGDISMAELGEDIDISHDTAMYENVPVVITVDKQNNMHGKLFQT